MTDGAPIVVQIHDVAKYYGDGVLVRALDGVSLTIHAGEFVAIMGPSGSGKSTLLHMLGALDRPSAGRIVIGGQDLAAVRDIDAFRSRTVGFVFQLHNLIPTMTARENVEVPLYETMGKTAERKARAEELLGQVGLGSRANHLPSQLSGGERQRVAIARALANRPALLLADEPTGSLDSRASGEVMELFRLLNKEQAVTIIVVTHEPSVARSADRLITLHDGKVESDGPMGDPVFESLRQLKRSPLGQALLAGETPASLADLGLTDAVPALRQALANLQ
jgi:ABC-type lipoprotein export system ATPase subunit